MVVAEDSFLVRAGVVRVLEATGFAVVGEAGDGDELLDAGRAGTGPTWSSRTSGCRPRNDDEGLRAAAVIRAELPGTGVLVLSQFVNERYAIQLLGESAAGVGYLLKDRVMEPRGFADAVTRGRPRGSALDPEVVAQMLERRRPGGPIDTLTPRECEVLARMAEGQANRAIAVGLGLSEHTLARDLAAIFEKLELPVDTEGHRRVLAVLTYLRAQEE